MAKTLKTSRTTKAKAAPAAKHATAPQRLLTRTPPKACSKDRGRCTQAHRLQAVAADCPDEGPGRRHDRADDPRHRLAAHTVRGTISGALRKRLGLTVVCAGDAGSRVYHMVAAA